MALIFVLKTVTPMKPGASVVIACIVQLAVVIASPIPASAENSPVNSPRRQSTGSSHQIQQDSILHHQRPVSHHQGGRQNAVQQQHQHIPQTRPTNDHHHPQKSKGLNPYAKPFVPVSTSNAYHSHAEDAPFTLAANHDEMRGIQSFLSKQKTDYLKSVGVDPSTAKKEAVFAIPEQVYQRLRDIRSRSSSERSHRSTVASKSGKEEIMQGDVVLSTKLQESISRGKSRSTSPKHHVEPPIYQGEHIAASKDHLSDHDKQPQHPVKIRSPSPLERSPMQSPKGSPSYHTPPQSLSPSGHSPNGLTQKDRHFVDAPESPKLVKSFDSGKGTAAQLTTNEAANPPFNSSSGKKKNRRGQGKKKAKAAAANHSLNRQDQKDFDKILDDHIEKHKEEYKTPPHQEESDGSDDSREKAVLETTARVGKLYLREKAQLRRQMANPSKYKNVAEKAAEFDHEEGKQKLAQKIYEKTQIERLANEYKISYAEARTAYKGYKTIAEAQVAHHHDTVQSPFGEGTSGEKSVPVTLPMFYRPSKSKTSKGNGKEPSSSTAASQSAFNSAASTSASASLGRMEESSQKKGKSKKTTPAGKKKSVVDEDDKIMEEFKAKHEEEAARAQALTPDQQIKLIKDAVDTANKGMHSIGLKAEARRKRLSKDPKRHQVEILKDAERRMKIMQEHLEMSKVIQKHLENEAMPDDKKVDRLKAEDLLHHVNQIYGAKVMAEAQDHLRSKKLPQKASSS